MGTLAVDALARAEDLSPVALVDPRRGAPLAGAAWFDALDEVDPGTLDVVIDLSDAPTARRTLAYVAANALCCVVGTSGLDDADVATASAAAREGGAHVVVVPNFSIGAVLLQRFAAEAAPYFASVEVVELHHDQKRDAPSGTSIATARAIAAARADAKMGNATDPTSAHTIQGARGAEGPGSIRIHSVRLPGLLAHQEVLFGAPGEGLTLRHDTYDRASFMSGLLVCVRGVAAVDGLAVGLESVLTA